MVVPSKEELEQAIGSYVKEVRRLSCAHWLLARHCGGFSLYEQEAGGRLLSPPVTDHRLVENAKKTYTDHAFTLIFHRIKPRT